MQNKMKQIGLVLLAVFCSGFGQINEIVLQNGLGEYQGCTDTHIDFKPAFTTFTKSDTLKVEHFYTAC